MTIRLLHALPLLLVASLPGLGVAVLVAGLFFAPTLIVASSDGTAVPANATLTALFLFVVFSILFFALKVGIRALNKKERTDKESPFQALPDA